jgi:hypothetical protein
MLHDKNEAKKSRKYKGTSLRQYVRLVVPLNAAVRRRAPADHDINMLLVMQ